MSSLTRSSANTAQGSRFFVNIVDAVSGTGAASNVFDATGAKVAFVGRDPWTAATISPLAAASNPPGTVLLRDMGKTIRIAAQGATNHAAAVPVSMVLRKVQIVETDVVSAMGAANVPLNSFIGLNEGVSGNAANNFETFYIQLAPVCAYASVSL